MTSASGTLFIFRTEDSPLTESQVIFKGAVRELVEKSSLLSSSLQPPMSLPSPSTGPVYLSKAAPPASVSLLLALRPESRQL